MADYPCDNHLSRYAGPSSRTYLNVFREDRCIRLKMSLCPECLADIVTAWVERALHETPDGHWDPGTEGLELETLWVASAEPNRGVVRPRR